MSNSKKPATAKRTAMDEAILRYSDVVIEVTEEDANTMSLKLLKHPDAPTNVEARVGVDWAKNRLYDLDNEEKEPTA